MNATVKRSGEGVDPNFGRRRCFTSWDNFLLVILLNRTLETDIKIRVS